MGSMRIYIPDELERRFRETAMRLFGYGRGSISLASEKAFEAWTHQASEVMATVESIEDPVAAIRGMLSNVKKTGVELQHEARGIRSRKASG